MRLKSRILGNLAYYMTVLLGMTLRVVISKHSEYNPKSQYLFAFWHGKQLLPVFELQSHGTRRAVLVSPSRDGDLLTVWLQKLGYEVVRGSSRTQNISALAGMIRKLKAGCSLGFGIDGPIGPIYKVKPGMTHMAQKFRIPIIPVGTAFSRRWVVEKAWDKYEIPKPFAKAVFYLGKPFYIEKGTDLAASNDMLEGLINDAEVAANKLL
jgi:lysophospholipid acyltransferase (LPLAT)-like uncharacterized protein